MHNNEYGRVPDFYYNEETECSKNKGRIKYPYSGTDIVHPKFRAN